MLQLVVSIEIQCLTVRHHRSHFASSDTKFFELRLLVSVSFWAFCVSDCFTTEYFSPVFSCLFRTSRCLTHHLLHLSGDRGAFGWFYFRQELGISILTKFSFFLDFVVSGSFVSLVWHIFCMMYRGFHFNHITRYSSICDGPRSL